MREVWPAERPMTVRISATDWVDGGTDPRRRPRDRPGLRGRRRRRDRRVDRPGHLGRAAGVRAVATRRRSPTRSATRLESPTIAVGVISSYDDVNSILLAGRADLCALGRVHLYDPSWTLHAAVEQDYDGPGAVWPMPWRAGRRKPQTGRTDGPKPRLQLIREADDAAPATAAGPPPVVEVCTRGGRAAPVSK